jgi:hypothetical protein
MYVSVPFLSPFRFTTDAKEGSCRPIRYDTTRICERRVANTIRIRYDTMLPHIPILTQAIIVPTPMARSWANLEANKKKKHVVLYSTSNKYAMPTRLGNSTTHSLPIPLSPTQTVKLKSSFPRPFPFLHSFHRVYTIVLRYPSACTRVLSPGPSIWYCSH